MKILQFIYDSPKNPWVAGGGANRVQYLLSHLTQKGHEVEIVCGSFPNALGTKNWNQLPTKYLGSSSNNYIWSTFTFAYQARKYLAAKESWADVIIEDFAPWNPIHTYRSSKPSILQIQNFLGSAISKKYPIIGHYFQRLERQYPARFKNRVYVNESLEEAYNLNGHIIPMGVDAPRIPTQKHSEKYILFLGRIDYAQKGIKDLISAAQRTDIPIKIAGKGPDEKRLKSEINGIQNISFLGPLYDEDKWNCINQCSFMVMPSRFEGQPLVAIEAAVAGKPILASDIRELDFISEENLGVQIDTRDPAKFTVQLKSWFSEPDRLETYSLSGQKFARARTWAVMADKLENYCDQLIREQKN